MRAIPDLPGFAASRSLRHFHNSASDFGCRDLGIADDSRLTSLRRLLAPLRIAHAKKDKTKRGEFARRGLARPFFRPYRTPRAVRRGQAAGRYRDCPCARPCNGRALVKIETLAMCRISKRISSLRFSDKTTCYASKSGIRMKLVVTDACFVVEAKRTRRCGRKPRGLANRETHRR